MKKILDCLSISKKTWIATILLSLFLQVGWAAGVEEGGLNPDGSLKRVAVIQIIPYNPLADIIEKDPPDEARVLLPLEVKAAFKLDADEFSRAEGTEKIAEYHLEPIPPGATTAEAAAAFDPGRVRYGLAVRPDEYGAAAATPGVFPEHGTYLDHFGFGRNCVYHVSDPKEFKWSPLPSTEPVVSEASHPAAAAAGISTTVPDTTAPTSMLPPKTAAVASGAGQSADADSGTASAVPAPASPTGYYEHRPHGYYLQKLAQYKKDLGLKENFLLVRMNLEIEGQEQKRPYEYFFGIFLSGAHKSLEITSCALDDLSTQLKESFRVETYKRNGLKPDDLCVKHFGKDVLLRKRKTIEEAADQVSTSAHSELILEKEKYKAGMRVYAKETFSLDEGYRLGILGQEEEDMNKLLSGRLWNFTPPLSKDMSFTAYKEIHRLRFLLLQRLFGDTLLTPLLARKLNVVHLDTEILDFGGAAGIVFNQSEQAFLSFLRKPAPENYMGTVPLLPTEGNIKHTVKSLRFDLYSTYDICRYCRATFAYMLFNQALRNSIVDFFKEKSIYLTIPQVPHFIQMFAFSNQQTKI